MGAFMCHAKPVRRSRLLLSEVDEILMPFFKTTPPSNIAAEAAAAAAGFTGEVKTQPPTGQDKLDRHCQGSLSPRGESNLYGASGGPRGEADTVRGHGGLARAGGSPRDAHEVDDETTTHRPPKTIPRSGRRVKRIRFTGAMGEFLDGPSVWNDFAIMEAERKASEAAAEGADGSRPQQQQQPRQQQQQQKQQAEQEQEEEEEEVEEMEEVEGRAGLGEGEMDQEDQKYQEGEGGDEEQWKKRGKEQTWCQSDTAGNEERQGGGMVAAERRCDETLAAGLSSPDSPDAPDPRPRRFPSGSS